MSIRLNRTVFFLLLLVFYLTNIFAQVQYVTANLNLRSGPGTNYEVLCVLPKGVSVTINKDCSCQWVRVKHKGYEGYLYAKYLSNYPIRNNSNYYSSNTRYYRNIDHEYVQSPTYYKTRPAGATALCRDGTYSFSRHRRGTCSHHGGVKIWY